MCGREVSKMERGRDLESGLGNRTNFTCMYVKFYNVNHLCIF